MFPRDVQLYDDSLIISLFGSQHHAISESVRDTPTDRKRADKKP